MNRSMRSGALLALAGGVIAGGVMGLGGCGKPARAPDHGNEVATTATQANAGPDAGPGAVAPVKDDCYGKDIDEIQRLLEKSACEMPPDAKEPKAVAVKDRLEIKVQPTSPKVASGQHL